MIDAIVVAILGAGNTFKHRLLRLLITMGVNAIKKRYKQWKKQQDEVAEQKEKDATDEKNIKEAKDAVQNGEKPEVVREKIKDVFNRTE